MDTSENTSKDPFDDTFKHHPPPEHPSEDTSPSDGLTRFLIGQWSQPHPIRLLPCKNLIYIKKISPPPPKKVARKDELAYSNESAIKIKRILKICLLIKNELFFQFCIGFV